MAEGLAASWRGAVGWLRRDLRVRVGVAALLALHAVLALDGVRDRSPTADEPLHLVAGVSYWQLDDYRLQPENGNLPMRWAAWPVVRQGARLPIEGETEAWRYTDAPRLQTLLLYSGANDPAQLLATARRAALVWTLALGLLVFAWARLLWGLPSGFLALTMHALSPTLLAHGPLVTSDTAAAFFLLAACGAWWRALERPTSGRIALSGLATGGCAVAKFSVVLLPFMFAPLAVWALYRRRIGWRALIALAAANVALPMLVIWASFGFRYTPAGPDAPPFAQYYRLWSVTLPPDGPVRAAVLAAREWQVLPEAYLYGFTHVLAFAAERSAFLRGASSVTGWWWFFPFAFLVKSTLAELALVGTAVVVGLRRIRSGARQSALPSGVAPLLALLLSYGAFSMASNLNIGQRHLLPMYGPLFILGSGILAAGATRVWRGIAVGVVVLACLEVAVARPHFLAFFNAGVGGPSQGWRYLVDSSLDWGQDLPRVSAWLRAHRRPGEPLYYSLFGAGLPSAYGIEGVEIAPDWPDTPRPWVEWRGGLYAVSATRLQATYNPFHVPWSPEAERLHQKLAPAARRAVASGALPAIVQPHDSLGGNLRTLELLQFARLAAYLRLRSPDAVVAHTVFLHRLTDEEVETALRGGTSEYLNLLEAAR